jgi:hypothetical protein
LVANGEDTTKPANECPWGEVRGLAGGEKRWRPREMKDCGSRILLGLVLIDAGLPPLHRYAYLVWFSVLLDEKEKTGLILGNL